MINSTGPTSSDLRIGLDILPGRNLTGMISLMIVRPGLMSNGLPGPMVSKNSGTSTVTKHPKVSNTGMKRIRKTGSHGSTLLTGKVSPGRNSTGAVLRMLKISNNGLLKTGPTGLSNSRLLLMKKTTKVFLMISMNGMRRVNNTSWKTLMLKTGKVFSGKTLTGSLSLTRTT